MHELERRIINSVSERGLVNVPSRNKSSQVALSVAMGGESPHTIARGILEKQNALSERNREIEREHICRGRMMQVAEEAKEEDHGWCYAAELRITRPCPS